MWVLVVYLMSWGHYTELSRIPGFPTEKECFFSGRIAVVNNGADFSCVHLPGPLKRPNTTDK